MKEANCCEKCNRNYGGGNTMLPLVRSCGNLDRECHKLPNKEECCNHCTFDNGFKYHHDDSCPCHRVSPSDKTWEQKYFVEYDDDSFRGMHFTFEGERMHFNNKQRRFIETILTSATIKAKEEVLRDMLDKIQRGDFMRYPNFQEEHLRAYAKLNGINLEEPSR